MEFTEFGNKSGKTLMLLPEKRHYQNPTSTSTPSCEVSRCLLWWRCWLPES